MSGYDIGYYVSMIVAIIGAMAAVFLFFFLDIPRVIKMSSGKQRRKRIREREVQYNAPNTSSDLSSSMTHNPLYIKNDGNSTGEAVGRQDFSSESSQTAQSSVTSVLKRGTAGSMTTVLQETGRTNPTMAPNKHFKIFQNVIVVHTQEKI